MSQLHDGGGDNVHGNKTSIYNIQLGAFIPVAILVLGIVVCTYFLYQRNHKPENVDISQPIEARDSISFNIFVVRLHHSMADKDTCCLDMTIEEQMHLLKTYEELGLHLNVHYMDSILPPMRIERDEDLGNMYID